MLRRCWLGFKVEFAFLFRHFLGNIELQLASLRYLQFLSLILAAPLALGYLRNATDTAKLQLITGVFVFRMSTVPRIPADGDDIYSVSHVHSLLQSFAPAS